ncbi:MAG TPA: amidase, partial [Burkholderiales bacterium]
MSSFRLAVKDNIDVAGLPTTAGLQAWRNRIAQHDAPVVSTLKKRGAVIVGKTLMDEAAFGALGDNPWYGRVHNPARHGYTAGGSSAGSAAAVASGEADLALGTDTLGSVRIPASYCGVVGYVPGAGRIDMTGVTPLAPSFDRVGFFTRTVGEMAAFMKLEGEASVPSVKVLTTHPHVLKA